MQAHAGKTVLIVDDEEHNRVILRDFLSSFGLNSIEAQNGPEALALLRNNSPDVILLDIMMPVMDGNEVLERIKADSRLNHIPVIVISAFDERSLIDNCIAKGADDYLVKPFDGSRLNARLEAAFRRNQLLDDERRLHAITEQILVQRNQQIDEVPASDTKSPDEQERGIGIREQGAVPVNTSLQYGKRNNSRTYVKLIAPMVLPILLCGVAIAVAIQLKPLQKTVQTGPDSLETKNGLLSADGSFKAAFDRKPTPPTPYDEMRSQSFDTMHFFGVGVAEYKDSTRSLMCPANDVEAIRDALRKIALPNKNSPGLFHKFQAHVLLNEDATRETILNDLRIFNKKRDLDQQDLVVFWFAGHGILDKQREHGRRFVFAPYDHKWEDANPAANGVAWELIKSEIASLPCKQVLVLDTCHSGQILFDIDQRGDVGGSVFEHELSESMKEHELSPVGTFAMSACMPQLYADESKPRWGHSALAKAMLELLNGEHVTDENEGLDVIKIEDVQSYVPGRVKELTDGQNVLWRASLDVDFSKVALGVFHPE